MAGTDLALRHGDVVTELLRLAAYGLSPAQVIDRALFDAHAYLGFDAGLRIGDPADLICVPGDPPEDLAVLRSPSLIMRTGRIVDPA